MSAWWDEDRKLLLLTKAEFDGLPDGEVLTCIDGTTAIKGKDEIDDDTRAGHLAYGVVGNHPLRVAHMERLLGLQQPARFEAPLHKVWSCKLGVVGGIDLPAGADAPMREAVERAFYELTGRHAEFNFSGWGSQLDKHEWEVVGRGAQ